MSITLHSFSIFVNDLNKAREFYEDRLGLPVRIQGSFGMQLLEAPPHVGVHKAEHPDAQRMVGRETGLTFEVDDLMRFCSELTASGVELVTDPTQQAFGIMALVADPDHNVIALWEDNISEEK